MQETSSFVGHIAYFLQKYQSWWKNPIVFFVEGMNLQVGLQTYVISSNSHHWSQPTSTTSSASTPSSYTCWYSSTSFTHKP